MAEKEIPSFFTSLARRRRSIRQFTNESLSQDEVVELMKAPLMAPSSKSKRPWHFVLVDNKDMLERLSESKPAGAQFLAGAALAVVVAVDSEKSDVWIEDGAVAATMLRLQAEALGLGACWAQIRERSFPDGTSAEEVVRSIVGLPENMRVVAIVGVGRKEKERKEQDESKLLWEQVHIDKF